MQVGHEVGFYAGPDADRRTATVAAIVGAGRSLAKRLDLDYREDGEDRQAKDVPHEADAEKGEAFWLLKGERRSREREELPDDEPPPLAVPDGAREHESVRKAAAKTAAKHG